MQQETANELVGGQGHRFDLAVVPIVLPLEAGPDRFLYRANGCWKSRRGAYNGLRNRGPAAVRRTAAWRTLPTRRPSCELPTRQRPRVDERTPGRQRIVICQNRRPSATTPETGVGTGARAPGQAKRNPVCRIPSSDHPVTIHRRGPRNANGDEPGGSVPRCAARRRSRSQPLDVGVSGDDLQSFCRGLEEDAVDHLLVLISDGGNLFRYGEDHVKVRDVEKLRLPILDPLRPRETLALGAMAIAAAIVGVAFIAALVAAFEMATEGRGRLSEHTSEL